MTDLMTWLRAQLDDDERVATDRARLAGDVWTAVEVAPGRWEVVGAGGRGTVAQGLPQWEAEHIARHDPARVLAEVDAKRRVLELHSSPDPHDDEQVWYQQAIGDVIRRMALPHADRPGYREEWRP